MEIGLISLAAGVVLFGMWLHSYLIESGLSVKYQRVKEREKNDVA